MAANPSFQYYPKSLEAMKPHEFLPLEGLPVIFLDYDGTLTPIVQNPKDAYLSERVRAVVKKLAHDLPVSIISGRDRKEIQWLVGLEEIYYAGSHGYDIAGPGGVSFELEEAKALMHQLKEVYHWLTRKLTDLSGIYFEQKRYSLAVHFRQATDASKQNLMADLNAIMNDYPDLTVNRGKQVLEIQPALEWDKGEAMLWLLEKIKHPNYLSVPIFIGDDLTDEDAFKKLPEGGIGILVGEIHRPTSANYHLSNVEEVTNFLQSVHTFYIDGKGDFNDKT